MPDTFLLINMNVPTTQMLRMFGVEGFSADPGMDVSRYQPGGDIYGSISSQYGPGAADRVASAAMSGSRADVTSAMASIRNGPAVGSTSTTVNFFNQITSDPLQAPIAAALGQGSSGPGLGGGTTSTLVKGVMGIGALALILYGLNTFAKLKH